MIETIREPKAYLSGGGEPKQKKDRKHDFLLFRQDFNGCESVYFDEGDLPEIISRIERGELRIHPSYSVLFARDETALQMAEEITAMCYGTTFDEAGK